MDAERFKHIVMPHYRRMYLVALKVTTDTNDAQDAVQDAVTKLWQQQRKLETADSVEAYVMMAARNAAVDVVRRRRQFDSIDNVAVVGPQADMEHELLVKDRVTHIMEIIDDLPEAQRSVILMRDVEGRDYDEIVVLTGFSNVNVRTLLSRARAAIRKHFKVV